MTVAGYGPRGSTQGGGTIYVRFNQAVVSLEQTNQDRTDVGIALDPTVAGRSYFQTPELLVFEPKDKLPIAHRITARLVGPVVALTGAPLVTPLQWELTTPRPLVSGWEVRDREDAEATRTSPVMITLEQPTTAAALQALLVAKAYPRGQGAAPARPAGGGARRRAHRSRAEAAEYLLPQRKSRGRLFLIAPIGLWPGQSQIELTVQKGLPTTLGPLRSERTFTTKFPTLSPLRLISADCPPNNPCGLTPIAIRFNNRIPESQLAKLRITPQPHEFQATLLDSWSEGGRELSLTGMFMPGATYRVQLPADFIDRFGQRLGQATTVVAVIARRPTMELNNDSGTLRTGERQTVGVVTRYVRTLRVRAAVLDDQTAVDLLTADPVPGTNDKPTPPPPWPAAPLRQFEHTYALTTTGPSSWHELTLDLAALSGQAHRAVLVEVQAGELVADAAGQPIPPPVRGLFRLTDLGPVGIASPSQQVLAVMRLSSGLPVAGAQLSLLQTGQPPQKLGQTDATGILVVPGKPVLPPLKAGKLSAMLVAESADDHAYMMWPEHDKKSHNSNDEAETPPGELRHGERVLTRAVTEREAYLPGELVRVVGWAAIDTPYQRSGLRRPRAGTPVLFELTDSRGRTVATHKTTLTSEGKFWAELPIPEHGSLGGHTVHAQILNTRAVARVLVEDFRVPDFSVAATVTRADLLPGESTAVNASATYFFGGPMRIQRAVYRQHCVATYYTPPGDHAGWSVGSPAMPAYRYCGGSSSALQGLPPGGLGQLHFTVRPTPEDEQCDRRCTVHVALTDSSFQTIGAQTDYLAHAARYYLALEQQSRTYTEGDTARVAVRALAVDGSRLAAPGVRVAVVWHHSERIFKLVDGQKVFDRVEEYRDPVRNCTLDLGASGPDLACQFPVAQPGSYEVLVRGRDQADTRYARAETALFVRPRPTEPPPPVVARRRTRELELLVSSEKVKPGDQLKVTLRAPWLTASGVLTLARNGVREHRAFQLHEGTTELTFPVDDTWFPGVELQAFVLRLAKIPHPQLEHAGAEVTLLQDHRRLQVAVTAPAEAGPGAELPITVRVQDAEQKPCVAHVALWAVDEAVLSLTNYSVPNPLGDFVPTLRANTMFHDDYRSFIEPFKPNGSDPWFELKGSQFGSRAGNLRGRRASAPSIGLGGVNERTPRNRFETTPLFLADVVTGPDGIVRTTAHLPDNLTTFRITAVASARLVDGDSPGRFGLGDARVRVSTPLIVRAALPRLMRPGDAAEIGALVNNLSGPRGRMQLAVRLIEKGAPTLQLTSPATAERPIAVGDQLRLPFTIVALRASKTAAVVEIKATLTPDAAGAQVLHDAVQLPLPVEAEPTLRERVAAYGDLTSNDAIRIPVQVPEAVRRDSGGLTISASTSLLGGVAEAAAELIEYPYGCVEQTASRLLPLVALREVLQTYPLPIPDGNVQRFVGAGVQRMLSMQTTEGGFAYWPGGSEPNVYASAYATWVLQLAQRSGYPVPAAELGRAADYLQRLVEPPAPVLAKAGSSDQKDKSADTDQADEDGSADSASADSASDDSASDAPTSLLLGHDYLDSARRALAVQVLAELGRPVPHALADLIHRRDELPLFARALLVLAVKAQKLSPAEPRLSAEALGEELLANIAELPGTAHVNEHATYNMESLFQSATRTDAMVLLALLRTHPQHPVIGKLARGLLERRGGAGWRNTQETAYAVLALAEYARLYEHETPALIARAWLPGVSARPQWEASFAGRSLGTQVVQLPMTQLLPGLLPAAGARQSADQNPSSAAALGSSGLILQRTGQGRLYYRVGLEWTPSAAELPARAQGLRVERHLRTTHGEVTADTLLPPAEPMAIDLVIENRALLNYVVVDVPLPAGLEAVQMNLGRGQQASTLPGVRSGQLSHEEARRDRALLFFDLLQPGTHRHTVYVRTTTPGRYTLPPAQAETMYTPELYGRSPSSRIVVTAQLP